MRAGQRLDDQRKAVGQVIAWTAIEPHPQAVLAGDDAEAVVLDFVNAQAAEGSVSVLVDRHGSMNPAGKIR